MRPTTNNENNKNKQWIKKGSNTSRKKLTISNRKILWVKLFSYEAAAAATAAPFVVGVVVDEHLRIIEIFNYLTKAFHMVSFKKYKRI